MTVETVVDKLYPSLSPADTVQTITGTATGGSGMLWFGVENTATLPFDVTAAALQTALENLPSVGAGNVTVTGGPLGAAPLSVSFIGALAGHPQPFITIGAGFTGGPVTGQDAVPRFYAVQGLVIFGAEAEGNQGGASIASTTFYALNLGLATPQVGTQVIVTLVSGLWYFRYDA